MSGAFLGPGLATSASAVFEAYRTWVEASGGRAMSVQALAEALEARSFEKKKTKTTRMWVGLGLKVSPGGGGGGELPFSDKSSHARAGERLS